MMVTVHLFARARDLAGSAILTLDLPDGATVAELRRRLGEVCPPLSGFLSRCAVAVDEDFAADDRVIPAGADVAVIPPVSGG